MSSTRWLNDTGFKLCTCNTRLNDLYPSKTSTRTDSHCSACGGKLTYERCTTCHGTGDGRCVVCHGIIPHGCFACGGTGFASTHDCPKLSKTSVKFDLGGIYQPPIRVPENPIDIPITIPIRCSACEGTGKVLNPTLGYSIDCAMCKGTGWRNQKEIGTDGSDGGSGWAWLIGGLVLLGLFLA